MEEAQEEAAARVADGLAYVCGHLDQIRAGLPGEGRADDASPLQRLLAAVRGGTDVAGPLDALHAALRKEGDVLGVYGHTRPGTGRGPRPAGVEPEPFETVYLCPSKRCSRRSRWPASTAVPLRCEISGQELRRERL